MQFMLDGNPLGTEVTAVPFNFDWDSDTVTPGAYVLTAVARDAAGNQTTSDPIGVTVPDLVAPQVSIGITTQHRRRKMTASAIVSGATAWFRHDPSLPPL